MNPVKPTTVDQYLKGVERADFVEELNRIRRIVAEEVPDAVECITYDMPTFKLGAKSFFHMAAFKNHCSLFGGHGEFVAELKQFKTSRGTIQFTPENTIPEDLLRRMIRARTTKLKD